MPVYISEQITGFKETERVVNVLEKYGLPTYAKFDKQKVFNVLKMDKKRERKEISYVLLEKIGKGVIKTISLDQLEKLYKNCDRYNKTIIIKGIIQAPTSKSSMQRACAAALLAKGQISYLSSRS